MKKELAIITSAFSFLLILIIVLVYYGSESNLIENQSIKYELKTRPEVVRRFSIEVARIQNCRFLPTGRKDEFYLSIQNPTDSLQYVFDLNKDGHGGTFLLLKECYQGFSEKNIRLFEKNFMEELGEKVKYYLLY